ncbi:MAG: hypothetical protein QXS74_09695 [Nitrososphaeria archaeon]
MSNIEDRIKKLEETIMQQQQQIKALNDELTAIGKGLSELVTMVKNMGVQSQAQTQQQQIGVDLARELGRQSGLDPNVIVALASVFKSLFGGESDIKSLLKLFEIYNAGQKDMLRMFAILTSPKRKSILEKLFGEIEDEEEKK